MRLVSRVSLLALITFVSSGMAAAQIPTSGNIFFGFSYARGEVGLNTRPMYGWNGSLEGKMMKYFGVVADFGAHYGSDTELPAIPVGGVSHISASRYTVMFGPRVSLPIGRYTPFVHALLGVGHENSGAGLSDTSFADAIGGGLDFKIVKGLAARVQIDNLQTRFYGGHQDHVRAGGGIVIRF